MIDDVRESFGSLIAEATPQLSIFHRVNYLALIAVTMLWLFDVITEIASCNDLFYSSDKHCAGGTYVFYWVVRTINYIVLIGDPLVGYKFNRTMINSDLDYQEVFISAGLISGLYFIVETYIHVDYSVFDSSSVTWFLWICVLSVVLFFNLLISLTMIKVIAFRFHSSIFISNMKFYKGDFYKDEEREWYIDNSKELMTTIESNALLLNIKMNLAAINCIFIFVACCLNTSNLNFLEFSVVSIIINLATLYQIISIIDKIKFMTKRNQINYTFKLYLGGIEVKDYTLFLPVISLIFLTVKEFYISAS